MAEYENEDQYEKLVDDDLEEVNEDGRNEEDEEIESLLKYWCTIMKLS